MKKYFKFLGFGLVLFLIILIMAEPEICKNRAISGILLSGRVIIPSTFPFTVCVLYLLKSGFCGNFGKKGELFSIIILSFIGGYPIGAKLLNEQVKNNKLNSNQAEIMLRFCINAGPAFIIGAVGNGIIGSVKIGYILFASHILASLILFAFNFKTSLKTYKLSNKKAENPADIFVSSVSEAANVSINICSFVIIFSVISGYMDLFSQKFAFLKYLSLSLEVTNAVSNTQNIYLISFMLGFAGISVWCQIISLAKEIKINLYSFVFFRILHGILSLIFTFCLIKLFKIALPCISNSVDLSGKAFYSTPVLTLSLFIMTIIFIISLFSKNCAGKLLDDVV